MTMQTMQEAPKSSPRGIAPGARLALFAGFLSFCVLGQGVAPGTAQPSVTGQVFAPPAAVRFDHIARAMTQGTYVIEQTRRVVDRAGSFVGVRERFVQDGSLSPVRFELRFQGIETGDLTGTEFQARMQRHRTHARFLNDFQSFYVHDAARAAANYDLVYLGDSRRLDRAVYRFEIRPRVLDRASWVLELDTVTGYPLYRGERLPTGALVSEVVVTSFATGSAAAIPTNVVWWEPLIPVLDFPSPAEGITLLNDARLFVPQRLALPSGYALHQSRATMMPFNREISFVLVYSDGIDTLVVTEKPIPGTQSGTPAEQEHRALLYSDQGMTQARFYHNTVEYLVVGRGVRDVVRRAAESVYREAVGR